MPVLDENKRLLRIEEYTLGDLSLNILKNFDPDEFDLQEIKFILKNFDNTYVTINFDEILGNTKK